MCPYKHDDDDSDDDVGSVRLPKVPGARAYIR